MNFRGNKVEKEIVGRGREGVVIIFSLKFPNKKIMFQ